MVALQDGSQRLLSFRLKSPSKPQVRKTSKPYHSVFPTHFDLRICYLPPYYLLTFLCEPRPVCSTIVSYCRSAVAPYSRWKTDSVIRTQNMMAVHQTPLSYSVAINLPNLQIGVSVCRSTILMSFKKCPAVFTTHHRRIMRCTAIRTYRRIFFVYLRTIRFRVTKLYPSIVVKQIHLLGFLFIHDLSIE